MPAHYVYRTEFDVRDYELDSEGIVNNAIYLHYLEHTRHCFCREAGFSFEEMRKQGMLPVDHPSETLLSQRAKNASGSCVLCAMEGSRPILVDIQALVTQSYYTAPRRTVNGMDNARIMLLLAVLEKRAGLRLYNQDVYINVAGGISLSEPAADLAVCMAAVSSFRDLVLPAEYAIMGEVGLAGEVRGIAHLDRRIAECRRLGFTDIVCPKDSVRKLKDQPDVHLHPVDTVAQAMAVLGVFSRG